MEHLPVRVESDNSREGDPDRSTYPDDFVKQIELLPDKIQRQFDNLYQLVKTKFFEYLSKLREEKIKQPLSSGGNTIEQLHYYLVEEPLREQKIARNSLGVYTEEDLQTRDRTEFELAAANNFLHVINRDYPAGRYLENLVNADDGDTQITVFMEMSWNNREIPDDKCVVEGTDGYNQLQQRLADNRQSNEKQEKEAQAEIARLSKKYRTIRSSKKKKQLDMQISEIKWRVQTLERKLSDESFSVRKAIADYDWRFQLQRSMTAILRRMEPDEFAILVLETIEHGLSWRYGKGCIPDSFSDAIEEWAKEHQGEKPLISPPPKISSPQRMKKLFEHFQRLAESYLRQKCRYKATDQKLSQYEPEISAALHILSKI